MMDILGIEHPQKIAQDVADELMTYWGSLGLTEKQIMSEINRAAQEIFKPKIEVVGNGNSKVINTRYAKRVVNPKYYGKIKTKNGL